LPEKTPFSPFGKPRPLTARYDGSKSSSLSSNAGALKLAKEKKKMTRKTPVPDDKRKRKRKAKSADDKAWYQVIKAEDRARLAPSWVLHLKNCTEETGDLGCWTLPASNDKKITFLSANKSDNNRVIVYLPKWLKSHDVAVTDLKNNPSAARVWFQLQLDADLLSTSVAASHLCQNPACVRPEHIVLEEQWINVSRNSCRVSTCRHEPKCMADGCTADFTPKKLPTRVYEPSP